MNKNFEEAYQAEVQLNIPDLWNRIESGLPEKKTAQNVVCMKENASVLPQKTKKKKKNTWIAWASLAAACMLLFMVVPSVIGLGLLGMVTKEETAADMAAPQVQYDAVTDMENAVAMEDAYWKDEVAMEDACMEETEAAPAPMEPGVESSVKGEGYQELIVAGLYAKVLEISEEDDVHEVVLVFSEKDYDVANNTFQGSEYYSDGKLFVTINTENGETPIVGEEYQVDIYYVMLHEEDDVGTYEAWLYEME